MIRRRTSSGTHHRETSRLAPVSTARRPIGRATGGVVLSTLLHASDADYRVVVIEDYCTDLDLELHETLLNRLFPQRSEVVTAGGFVKALQST
jgi:nicotinamidase-related amidase